MKSAGRKIIRAVPRGRRLKGLDEFQTPEFVGRMERVERRRKLEWWAMLTIAVVAGTALGLALP